jgi:hypothetical protein
VGARSGGRAFRTTADGSRKRKARANFLSALMRAHGAGVFVSVGTTTERDSGMVEYFLWQQVEGSPGFYFWERLGDFAPGFERLLREGSGRAGALINRPLFSAMPVR